jgi:hypothetical protein
MSQILQVSKYVDVSMYRPKKAANRKLLRYERKMTAKQEEELAAKIGNKLSAYYPGHIWAVNIDQGVVRIKNLYLSKRMGFKLRVADVTPEMTEIMRAGGELLERFRQRRGWADEAALVVALKDIRGDMRHDS